MQSNTFRFVSTAFATAVAVTFLTVLPQGGRAQSAAIGPARKTLGAGVYTDKKAKSRHTWQINGAHTLLWDGAPYLPVGGTFTPKSFSAAAASAWQDDAAALNTLKAHGIHDIIIWPEQPLIDVPVAALQRLVDFLDANDFNYGLSFGMGLNTPVTGYVVKPSVYRYEDSRELTALWQVSGVDRALYFLVDAGNDSRFIRANQATVRDGIASASLDVPPNLNVVRAVALLVPHRTLPVSPQGNLPDLWNRFDNYRDQVLTYLEPVKFGSGFRFYLDPLARHLGLAGEADGLVPDSDAFRLEWESYLTKNFNSVDEIKNRWLLADNFQSIQEMARLIPLWKGDRGIPFDRGFPYLFDPVTGKAYKAQLTESLISTWWTDFQSWRDQSISYYMNAMADTLKHQVADVPVVYTWTQTEPIFSAADPAGGFDGLAINTRAQDPYRLSRVTGPAYSAAEQNHRSMWLLATEISPFSAVPRGNAAPLPATTATITGYAGSRQLDADLTDLRRIGLKGMFVNGLQATPASDGSSDWLHTPESLDWLHTFAANLTSDASEANFTPRVLYYPQSIPGPARTMLINGTSGVYWLPAAIGGKSLTWWPGFAGYIMQRDEDQPAETVLLSLNGPRLTRVFAPDVTKISARSPEGAAIPLKILTKSSVAVRLDATPTIFITGGQEMVPEAAAADALEQLGLLNRLSQGQERTATNTGKTELGEVDLKQAMMFFNQKNFGAAYASARQMIDRMVDEYRPYIWLEGEATGAHNFTEVAPHAEASGGAFLRLNTLNQPHNPPHYAALYVFDVPDDEDYQIWLAGSTPGPETSPISWYIDKRSEQEPANPVPQGPLYLQDRFGWIKLGTAHLEKGNHRLSIKITDRAATTGIYSYAIDALLLMPVKREFVPNTTIKPVPIDPETAKAILKKSPKPQRGKQK